MNRLQTTMETELVLKQEESELTTAWRLLIHIRNELNAQLRGTNLDGHDYSLLDDAIDGIFEAQTSLENMKGVVR